MKTSRKVALGGIISALSLVFMFLSSIVPFAEYSCPALAGIFLVVLVIEMNKRTAALTYLVISILSILIVPNKEAAILFIGFLGYYPILKSLLEQGKSRIIEWLFKLCIFNVMIVLSYFVMIHLFGISDLYEDIGIFKEYGLVVLIALGNIAFILYDIALTRLIITYIQRIKPKIKSILK